MRSIPRNRFNNPNISAEKTYYSQFETMTLRRRPTRRIGGSYWNHAARTSQDVLAVMKPLRKMSETFGLTCYVEILN